MEYNMFKEIHVLGEVIRVQSTIADDGMSQLGFYYEGEYHVIGVHRDGCLWPEDEVVQLVVSEIYKLKGIL